jgi:hypothetical protein
MSVVPIFLTLMFWQHPEGMSKNTDALTLKKSSTAAGVTIIVVEGIASPSTAIAI